MPRIRSRPPRSRLARTNATRLEFGAGTGSSPSPSSTGSPPATGAAHTCILGWTGLLAGFGIRFPSAAQFAP